MEIALLYLLFIFPLICIFWGLATVIGLIMARGVPFVPLSKTQLGNITTYVNIPANARVVDLGSGDGRVLRHLEKNYGIHSPVGYEINCWAYWKSRILNRIFRSTATVHCRNFFKEDLSEHDVVFCYLLSPCLSRLREKFDKELKPGTKVISYAFEIKDWRTPEVIYCDKNNHNRSRIFIYTI